jgi:hypothetical protein
MSPDVGIAGTGRGALSPQQSLHERHVCTVTRELMSPECPSSIHVCSSRIAHLLLRVKIVVSSREPDQTVMVDGGLGATLRSPSTLRYSNE